MKAKLRMINTALFQLTAAFLLGVLFGCFLVASGNAYHEPYSYGGAPSLLVLLWLPLITLLLGTSTVGYWLIPLLASLRGYLLSASFIILILSGTPLKTALLMIGLPGLFSVPAFFLLCEDAVSSSRIICLCSECSISKSCGYFQPLRLLLSLVLLVSAAVVQIYFIPLIV